LTIIQEATLEIDREWMNEDNGNELSRDLVKSFLLDFIYKTDQSKSDGRWDLLFNHKTTKDQFALSMQDVFNTKKDFFSQTICKMTVRCGKSLKRMRKLFFR
jgi:hypothetical protein